MATAKDLKRFSDSMPLEGKTMPMLFVGHGNPMNAIEDNEFSRGWQMIGKELPKPRAVLCISAHWETKGTYVTAMERPETIHDFYGFPVELFEVRYPAPGSPELATETKDVIKKGAVELDQSWGLDHGCWSVVRHMYPEANVPTIEMSLDYTKPALWHYELARELSELRAKGVLIIGSGNMVHNLRLADWQHPDETFDWALETNGRFKQLISNNDHRSLIDYQQLGRPAELSIPTPEHYLPMLYVLGLKGEDEEIKFFNDRTLLGSISMTSFSVGYPSRIGA